MCYKLKKTNVVEKLLMGLSFGTSFSQALATVTPKFRLYDDWQIQSSALVPDDGTKVSSAGFNTAGWIPAKVPSTVLGTLSTQLPQYANLLEGTKYKTVDKTLFDCPWWYRKTFDIDGFDGSCHAHLMLDGISYSANVWLNGRLILSRDTLKGPFRRFSVDITSVAKARNNVLAVEVYKAQPGDPNIGFADWNPRPADDNMGIFREVWIKVTGDVAISRPYISTALVYDKPLKALLTTETTLTNLAGNRVKGVLRLELEGRHYDKEITLEPRETRVVRLDADEADMLAVVNPRLWWCLGMGEPEMYDMRFTFVKDGKPTDCDRVAFGVREIESRLNAQGHRMFTLNKRPVLLRGAGWTDDIFLRNTPERNARELALVAGMNLNTVRFENIWGTSQSLYDECDRRGLMVLTGWSCFWEWDAYLGSKCDDYGGVRSEENMNLVAASLKDQMYWLRNHPSIIGYFVGSDMLPRPELEKRYLEYFDKIDNKVYIGAAKQLNSSLTGPTGTKMAGPYEYVSPLYWYSEHAPGGAFGFNTETGIGAQLPQKESLKRMIPVDKLWPINEVWNYHCTASSGGMNNLDVLQTVADAYYGRSACLDDFLPKADLINYDGTRAMFEAFRCSVPGATGVVQWMLNSAWPSLYWQLYDYYLQPTAAYYSVCNACKPVQLVYNYAERAVYAVNETLYAADIEAGMSLCGVKETVPEVQRKRLTVQPFTPVKVFDVGKSGNGVSFLFLEAAYTDAASVRCNVTNTYCVSDEDDEYDWAKSDWKATPITRYADFKALADLPKVDCGMKVERTREGIKVRLVNSGKAVAFFIRLSLTGEDGFLVQRAEWEDNYVSLLPGEERVVECRLDHSDSDGRKLVLAAEGWNVARVENCL